MKSKVRVNKRDKELIIILYIEITRQKEELYYIFFLHQEIEPNNEERSGRKKREREREREDRDRDRDRGGDKR